MKSKINRFERKWIYKSKNYLALVNSLFRSDLFFTTQYPNRKVNSIYFDDYNFSSIRENLDGEQAKLTIDKKEIRVWKFPVETIETTKLNNKDVKGAVKAHEKMMIEREQKEGSRYSSKKPY